ncbi:MAG TPA: fumarylacetoacetate hydrolase family protein [Eoetvoesiella sp.]
MHLLAYTHLDQPRIGVLDAVNDNIIDLTSAGLPSTLDELIQLGASGLQMVAAAVSTAKVRTPLNDVTLLPPVRNPSKAIAVGLNYVDHAAEADFVAPTYPIFFSRYSSSWVAHDQKLHKPKASSEFDYEGELVIVIGKEGRHISHENALEHVYGYSVFNEGSVRDFQWKSQQWTMGKNFDKSGSFGPYLVTADSLPAGAKNLRIETKLNNSVVQQATTNDMIFDVATLISVVSVAFALSPGDIIISGTPSGVGFARTPPLFMQAGDICEVYIEGIGTLRNQVIDEPAPLLGGNIQVQNHD